MGGFPTWTLIGMGVSAGLAVILTALAYLAQSPNLLVRFRMAGSRLSQSGRRLTGLGLAATLVAGGFFMAGVPLGGTDQTAGSGTEIAELPTDDQVNGGSGTDEAASASLSEDGELPTAETGAFGAPPPESAAPSAESQTGAQAEAESESEDAADTSGAFSQPAQATTDADGSAAVADSAAAPTSSPQPTASPAPTQTPTPTSTPAPTSTPTPTPTNTPTPTMTPTAVNDDDTITVSFDGEITWVYRVPGNQRLELVDNGEQLLLEPGRAMVVGITWQEVRLLDGRPGWIQLNFLDLGDEN